MKKLVMTFAIVAFLIGGLSLNASAQDRTATKPKAKVENKTEKPQVKENYDQMLKDYETNVDKYIEAYEKALKADKATTKVEDYKPYLKKAQELEAKLEKAKANLNDKQLERFLKIKQKLAAALTKK